MKKKAPVILLLVLALFVLAACGTPPAPTGENVVSQPTDDTSTVDEQPVVDGTPISGDVLLDPALATDADSQMVIGSVYEALFKIQDGAPVPSLAISAVPSEDGLAYTISLRPGVKFHNGSALNADAVVANFDRWFDPENPAHGSGSFDAWENAFFGFKGEVDNGKPKSIFDGAEKLDELTVILHLNTPDTDFLAKLADPAFSIVSPDAFNASGFGSSGGHDGGTGPYMVSTFNDTGLVLSPFADYWNPAAIQSESMSFTFSE